MCILMISNRMKKNKVKNRIIRIQKILIYLKKMQMINKIKKKRKRRKRKRMGKRRKNQKMNMQMILNNQMKIKMMIQKKFFMRIQEKVMKILLIFHPKILKKIETPLKIKNLLKSNNNLK